MRAPVVFRLATRGLSHTYSIRMKTLHRLSLVVIGLVLSASLGAQISTPEAPSSGLLGKRYVEASTFLIDYQNFPDHGYGLGTAVNVPLTANLDVGAFFQYNWTESDASDHFQDLGVYLAAYVERGKFRPFARATIAYEWWTVSDDPWYQIDLGSEYLISDRLSVSAQVSWVEFLSGDWNGGSFAGTGRANYWVTTGIATSVYVTYAEGGTWTYGLGAVFKF